MGEPLLKPTSVLREGEAYAEVNKRDAAEYLEGGEGSLDHLAAGERQLPNTNKRNNRCCLDEHHAGVDEGGRSKP